MEDSEESRGFPTDFPETLARVAIEAMRTPTEDMLSCADSAIPRAETEEDGSRMMGREVALRAWEAMIDAALGKHRA